MIEIERQVSEAPAICVIVQWDVSAQRPHIARFEDENGKTIAYPGQDEFRRIVAANFEVVAAAVQDCNDEAKRQRMIK